MPSISSDLRHLISPSSLDHHTTSNFHVWDASKLIPFKSTCWRTNCIRLICSGHTMPGFDTVLPVIKWWNHQGSALAAHVVPSQDVDGWQINSSSAASLSLSLFSSTIYYWIYFGVEANRRDSPRELELVDGIKISGIFRLYGSGDILGQI